MSRLLAVDIGNTNATFGVFKENGLLNKFDIATERLSRADLKVKLRGIRFDDAIICSVVPFATGILKKAIERTLGKNPFITGKGFTVPVKNLYRKPKQVGQDRLVNAYTALHIYGPPAIVVDFGTAITFDALSKKKEYLGGMIIPGLKISLEALNMRTALLPAVKLDEPEGLIGRDTRNSMLSGMIYGFSSLTDALIARIKKTIGKNARVIATGGNAGLILKYCRAIDRIDPDLTLKGLNMLFADKDSRAR